MGRRALPSTMMKEAVDERDVEKFAWAILEQSRLDLANHGENRAYSTVDVLSAMRQIVILQKAAPPETDTPEKNNELDDWLKSKKKTATNKTL